MEKKKKKEDTYNGFELGPIRPPSEYKSLLLRLTRNCSWNHCTFCGIYKTRRFSVRSVENIIKDIDLIHEYIQGIMQHIPSDGYTDNELMKTLYNSFEKKDRVAFNSAANWYAMGMKSVFLQDADALVMKPDDLVYILEYIRKCFPNIERITSYARSDTVARIKQEDLKRMVDAGLNRVHIGLETGSDLILKKIRKGLERSIHIKAGLKAKKAGMDLSVYVVPGLGGIDYSIENALETALIINNINPDSIRIRTLAVTNGTLLASEANRGEFEKATDAMIAKELRLFLESLDGIDSDIKSDHILNLFETMNGKMPEDKDKMIGIIDQFFELEPEKRVIYQIGRRMGFFMGPDEMDASPHLKQVRQAVAFYGVTPENVDSVIDELMRRFV